jgi:crotonobetainyl-CoA:carnitine CoA-transferase CaiB-like acyl-CoA transferase
VVLSITGFGPDGPDAHRPGYDQVAQGEGGLMSLTGEPGTPTRFGVPITDLLAGLFGVVGVLAALAERATTGRGRVVRTSLLAAAVGVHAYQGTRWTVAGQAPAAQGNHHPSIAPYGTFQAADGPLQVCVGTEAQWRALAGLLGLDAEDPRFATNGARVEHRETLAALLDARLGHWPAAHWQPLLDAAGVPAGQIRTVPEVYEWAQTRSQGLVESLLHPVLGAIEVPGFPIRFEPSARDLPAPPPALDEHGPAVRAWLGLP